VVRRYILLLGPVAAAAAVVLLVGLAGGWWQEGGRAPRPSRPLVASTSLSPRALEFGDPLDARLELLVDPAVVDPTSIRVEPRFAPYRVRATAAEIRSAGRAELVSRSFALECLTPACVPERQQVERRFLPVVVSYRTVAGRAGTMAIDWPTVRLSSHLSDAERAAPAANLRVDAPLPPVSYRLEPAALRAGLVAGAGALAVLAAAFAALGLRRPREAAPAPEPELEPLARALLLVRASATNGFPAERRKALSRLARELGASGRSDLAHTAARLAWSAESPSADAAGTFAAHVEESLGKKT
jgi:hypothetical protein